MSDVTSDIRMLRLCQLMVADGRAAQSLGEVQSDRKWKPARAEQVRPAGGDLAIC